MNYEFEIPNYSDYKLTILTNYTVNVSIQYQTATQKSVIFNGKIGSFNLSEYINKVQMNNILTSQTSEMDFNTKPASQFLIKVHLLNVPIEPTDDLDIVPSILAFVRITLDIQLNGEMKLDQLYEFLFILVISMAVIEIYRMLYPSKQFTNNPDNRYHLMPSDQTSNQVGIVDRMKAISTIGFCHGPHPFVFIPLFIFYLSSTVYWNYSVDTFVTTGNTALTTLNQPTSAILYFSLVILCVHSFIDMTSDHLKIVWTMPISRVRYIGMSIVRYLNFMILVNILLSYVFVGYRSIVLYSQPINWSEFIILWMELNLLSLTYSTIILSTIILTNDIIHGAIISTLIVGVAQIIQSISWFEVYYKNIDRNF